MLSHVNHLRQDPGEGALIRKRTSSGLGKALDTKILKYPIYGHLVEQNKNMLLTVCLKPHLFTEMYHNMQLLLYKLFNWIVTTNLEYCQDHTCDKMWKLKYKN